MHQYKVKIPKKKKKTCCKIGKVPEIIKMPKKLILLKK